MLYNAVNVDRPLIIHVNVYPGGLGEGFRVGEGWAYHV